MALKDHDKGSNSLDLPVAKALPLKEAGDISNVKIT
jgi:hypothetical protein